MTPLDKAAERAALISLASTCVVVVIKLAGAWQSGSVSVLAEGLQSTLDIFMSAMVLWGLRLARRPPDNDHPFGHAKAELLISLLQIALATGVAVLIMTQAAPKLWSPPEIKADVGLAFMAMAVLINLGVIAYVSQAGARTGSAALKGEAAHLWSDTFASVGVLAGLGAVWLFQIPLLDPLVALVFTGLGVVVLFRRAREVVHPLMDGSLPEADLYILAQTLKAHPDVKGFHKVMTRSTGRERRILLHVLLDDNLTFVEAHERAEEIEDELSAALGGAEVTVHYEPHDAELEHRKVHHGEGTDLAQVDPTLRTELDPGGSLRE